MIFATYYLQIKYFKNDINQKAKVKIIQDVVLKFLKANGNVFLKTVFQ